MIGNDWDSLLEEELKKEYFNNLINFVKSEYKSKTIYPKESEIFNAFRHTKYKDVKVVILGQDPYHGENQAEGLSFSVKHGIKRPPSLVNIYKELNNDLNIPIIEDGSLVKWAEQGVLLLNAVLTVEKDKAASHQGKGWEIFTDEVIKLINKKDTPVVFILWGNYARSKKKYITNPIHYIIESAHPSPLSAHNGFFGSKPFSKTNNFLIKNNLKPINWDLSK
jgi:uracil-DNA glycosylase